MACRDDAALALEGFIKVAKLSESAAAVARAWAAACTSESPSERDIAIEMTEQALNAHTRRLGLIYEDGHSVGQALSLIVVEPLYEEFQESLKCGVEMERFLHPSSLVAGVGPYASGEHLILCLRRFDSDVESAPSSGFEFVEVWDARLRSVLPTLADAAQPSTRAVIARLLKDAAARRKAILDAIKHHELGHADHSARVAHRSEVGRSEVLGAAIADLQADALTIDSASSDVLILTLCYHVYNLRHLWTGELATFAPASARPGDHDLFGAVAVVSQVVDCLNRGELLSDTLIRRSIYDARELLCTSGFPEDLSLFCDAVDVDENTSLWRSGKLASASARRGQGQPHLRGQEQLEAALLELNTALQPCMRV